MNDIYGTSDNDTLTGTAGRDEIIGRAGNDILRGLAGADEIYGGPGNDLIDGGRGDDELTGGPGNDTFVVGEGRDVIEDFRPGDRIEIAATAGPDNFADLLALARSRDGGDDTFFDFGGGDTLLLEDVSRSRLEESWFTFAGPADPGPGVSGPPVAPPPLDRTERDNDKVGTSGNDLIRGTAGNDDLYGGAGRDRLFGGAGNDDLYGGGGRDRLVGGSGDDDLRGGAGDDVFVFHRGRDEIEDFGRGDDVIVLAARLGVRTFADLDIRRSSEDDDDTVILFGNGDRLVLEDVAPGRLSADDFEFG